MLEKRCVHRSPNDSIVSVYLSVSLAAAAAAHIENELRQSLVVVTDFYGPIGL